MEVKKSSSKIKRNLDFWKNKLSKEHKVSTKTVHKDCQGWFGYEALQALGQTGHFQANQGHKGLMSKTSNWLARHSFWYGNILFWWENLGDHQKVQCPKWLDLLQGLFQHPWVGQECVQNQKPRLNYDLGSNGLNWQKNHHFFYSK